MTRYVILCGNKYVAAVQTDTKKILLTTEKEDAGSWVTYERTIKAARFVQDTTGNAVVIQSVQEKEYSRFWSGCE